ncbi:hypothetical protein CUJ83_00490 [Methanocella sp. CWC-04]|uniref:Uncharacterized protein n=1 Tax=Methanooceanicella nereidis TaxID=2052831 RepID=A0AAP2W5K9_9EURY|nr:hypothetical protein [Methanocella sp. CWC-04]MCD1293474.1 hypothetical protein [Methanocella sp. CWC-04]
MSVLFDALLVLFIMTLGIAAISFTVSAHKPIFEEKDTTGYGDAIRIPDPEISWAIYGFLDHSGDVDYYYFDAEDGFKLYTNLLVPKNDVYVNFRPSYAVVGPGISSRPEGLPFSIPDGMGALVIDDTSAERDIFYEPFTATTYYRGPKKYTSLSAAGRYYIVVFDKGNDRGDYVLAVGEKEVFGIDDIPGVISAILKIRSGGVDHSQQMAGGK